MPDLKLIAFTVALAGLGFAAVYLTAAAIASHTALPLILLAVACLVAAFFVVRNNRKELGA